MITRHVEGRIFTPNFYEKEMPPEKGLKHDPSSEESASNSGNSDYIERIERETEFFDENQVKNEPDQNSDGTQDHSGVKLEL